MLYMHRCAQATGFLLPVRYADAGVVTTCCLLGWAFCCCCSVIVLEDNDVLHIVGGGYGIYNTAQADVETAVPRELLRLEVEVDQIMKVSTGPFGVVGAR